MAINFSYNYPQMARDAGFKLRQFKDGPLDWRLMGSLEVERLLRDQTFEQIDGALAHLSEAPLGSILDTNILDSGIAKYFALSQFAIQYLLFCRKFLDETISELREAYAASQLEVAQLRKSLTESNNEILQLHKKMTQIEAIHEVVYPCHLCTKSFVSNESLNIHIARKHNSNAGRSVLPMERRAETPLSAQKERENDLNLINTIKLELEIKQLKERLNIAEKDIRERSAANSKKPSPREQQRTEKTLEKDTKNIGIQSNLMEAKEKNDMDETVDEHEVRERKQKLQELQEKLHDFENWRERQEMNNEESIAEINKKLAEITQALQTHTRESSEAEERSAMAAAAPLQRRASPSVEDLERLLTQKVNEIGKASAEKLEEVVHQMDLNYLKKLEELERDIKQRNEVRTATKNKVEILRESDSETERESTVVRVRRNIRKPGLRAKRAIDMSSKDEPKKQNETYVIEEFNESLKQAETTLKQQARVSEVQEIFTRAEPASMSTESNRTFVKTHESKAEIKAAALTQTIDVQSDSTDISQSLSEESHNSDESSDVEKDDIKAKMLEPRQESEKLQEAVDEDMAESKEDEVKKKPKEKTPSPPKPFTRKDAKKLANRRFIVYGFDMKTNAIAAPTMRRVSGELSEKRNKLKQKYPHFYATRNKIKKLVDKLCSNKLPEQADAMLKTKKPLRPAPEKVQIHEQSPRSISPANSFELMEPEASTPLQKPSESDVFKRRLERILASPARQPGEQMTVAQMHNLPVPMPRRRRVMFNSDTKLSDGDEEEEESLDEERLSELRAQNKRAMESSLGSLL